MRLIDADKLIEETQEHIDEWNGWEDTRGGMKIIQEVIREMPTVDAEPIRHGHWIPLYPHDAPITNLYKCSVCGLGYEDDDTDCEVYYPWNYCPHCGAKMNEVNDETN